MLKRIHLMRPFVGKQEIEEIEKVFKTKFLTEGEITKKFEKSITDYTKTKYGIATTSATTALHTMFHCMGVKGKKVLVSDFTFPATVLAIIQAGGKPELVDVEKDTMNISREIVENSLTKDIEFIAPVSLFGNPLDYDFYKLKNQGLKIIEDAATNLGTKVNEKFVGELADVTCFSFHPRKIITTGEGGMIVTNNKKIEDSMKTFKTFGKKKSEFIEIGTNYKISDIQSAIGLVQMKKIEKIIKNRINKAKIYDELFSKIDFIFPQEKTKKSRHTYQSYTCIITKTGLRNKIIKKLSEKNIESQIGTYALHCLPAFKKIKNHNPKNSEYLYKNSISFPLHEELSEKDQKFIYSIIKNEIV